VRRCTVRAVRCSIMADYFVLHFASLDIKYDVISPISRVSEAGSASNCNCIATGEWIDCKSRGIGDEDGD
jgi:hypothetical protein